MRIKDVRLALFAMAIVLQNQCATDQAASLRDDKSVTIGLLGAAYRPTDSFTVSVDAAFGGDKVVKLLPLMMISQDRDIKYKGTAVDLSLLFHPFDTSAFFIGLGGADVARVR